MSARLTVYVVIAGIVALVAVNCRPVGQEPGVRGYGYNRFTG